MKIRTTSFIFLFVAVMFLIGVALPVGAAPQPQGFITSTPGADGRITYVVQEGDTCSQVAFLHGITVTQLRQFNTRLDENCVLTPNQPLVVGLSISNVPTSDVIATLASPTVTLTPVSGTTEVCVLLFNDANGDALRQETEFGIDGGAVSLTNVNGSYSKTENTSSATDPDTLEPIRACFLDVPQGDYNISMAIPDNYNPTMLVSYKLNVKAGDRASIDFGAQSKTVSIDDPTQTEENGRSPMLGIFGLLLLVGGAALGFFAYRSSQPKSKLKGSPLDRR